MKCLMIYNPKSGKGKLVGQEKTIVQKLKSKFSIVDVQRTEYAGHAIELAQNSCGKYDVLVCAGGDGTLSEVVNGVEEKEKAPIIGYIPVGTVNDFAHSVGIPNNINKAVDKIINGVPFSHDIFKVNNKYGIYVCCAGLFTETSYNTNQKNKKKLGKVAYVFHGMKKMFSTKSLKVKFSSEEMIYEGKLAMMLMANSRYVASFPINKKACLNDGLVDVVLIKEKKNKVSLSGVNKVLSMFLFGINRKPNNKVLRLKLKSFDIETDDNTTINIDGEKGESGSFHFEVIKEGVKIFI